MLPDGNGFEFCAELRASGQAGDAQLIFISAKDGVQDRVVGWSLGADDYICKPFSPIEVQARIRNRLERAQSRKSSEEILRWEALTINIPFHEASLMVNGKVERLDLTPIEFKILYCLIKNRDRISSRDNLIRLAWGATMHISERTVDKHISSLRKKIGIEKDLIKTVAGVGYRLTKAA